ncbi:RHS repeat-associated core domain-containing protein [Xinfangfangia pollutisoli]|uniref:RHS repeat-associated core domain-containing protein n=1 Tax=Xinfangfangia pollutisoli TaxID=2865960 RepID=UPI001CD36597|nr:RHS repeat-associated core domain-containing protein [Xinfangfangia pollutisoli]
MGYDTDDLGDSTASNTALTFRPGVLIKRWIFGPQVDEPVAYEAYSGTTAPGSGSVIELLANRLGSIITAISVSTGAVAAEYDYQAYGIRTESAVIDQPYGFTGREHDAESGLIYLRMRTYDPAAEVFLQTDPIEFAGGYFNLFAYVGGDPTNGSDPSGMFESLSWHQMTMGSAALAGAAAWTAANSDSDSTLFGSVIGLVNSISASLNQIVPGVWPQPMSDAGVAW